MVNLYAPSKKAQQEYLDRNLEMFIHTHPNEYVLISGGIANIENTFYQTKEELKKAMKKYDKEDVTVRLIPKSMAGFKGKTYAEKTTELLEAIQESQIRARKSRLVCGKNIESCL